MNKYIITAFIVYENDNKHLMMHKRSSGKHDNRNVP
jgi:hypothetical protein